MVKFLKTLSIKFNLCEISTISIFITLIANSQFTTIQKKNKFFNYKLFLNENVGQKLNCNSVNKYTVFALNLKF